MFEWPQVFQDGTADYSGPTGRAEAISDGLSGWGLCYAGAPIPEKFGWGMICIAKATDLSVVDLKKNLIKEADKFLKG